MGLQDCSNVMNTTVFNQKPFLPAFGYSTVHSTTTMRYARAHRAQTARHQNDVLKSTTLAHPRSSNSSSSSKNVRKLPCSFELWHHSENRPLCCHRGALCCHRGVRVRGVVRHRIPYTLTGDLDFASRAHGCGPLFTPVITSARCTIR